MADRRATAYHEAGHAVAAVVLRHGIRYATVAATDDSEGHVRYVTAAPNPDPQEQPDWRGGRMPETVEDQLALHRWALTSDARETLVRKRARERLVIRAAASVAQGMVDGNASLLSEEAGSDRNNIIRTLTQLGEGVLVEPGEEDYTDAVATVVEAAEHLMRRYWPAVERVATELLKRETVSGRWVRRAVRQPRP